MNYNKTSLVLLIGILSTIPYEIFTRIMVAIGIAKYGVYELASLMITLNRPNLILGAVTSMILSGVIALVFYHSLKVFGWDYLLIKSIFFNLLSWLFLEIFFMWLVEGRNLISARPLNDYFTELLGSIVLGITIGLLFKKYLRKEYITN